MRPQDFQEYGPIQRRRGGDSQRNMATPYSGPTMELPTLPGRRQPAPVVPPTRGRLPVAVIVLLLLAAVGGGTYAGLRYLDERYSGHIFPGVAVQGVDLSEQTPAAATSLVNARFADFLAQPVTFEFGGRQWHPTAVELGVQLNIDEQVAAAASAGRSNGLAKNAQQVATIYQEGLDLPLSLMVDEQRIQDYLATITADLVQAPVEADLRIDPVTGAMSSRDSRSGRVVQLNAVVADVVAHLQMLQPYTAPLEVTTLNPTLTTAGIAEAKRTIAAMTQAPMTLTFHSQTFALAQIDIANMVVINRIDGATGPQLNAQLDQKVLRKWVTKLADKIGRDSVEPRVAWNGGALQITQPGRSAYRLDLERTITRINEAIVGPNRTLDLPVDEVQPQATPETLASLGINQLISVGQSDFSGSAAYRITNIKAGVKLMNGILIPPDGEFSFNENVGAIDEAHGFTEGYAIVGNRTQKEPGGGICQVSTTLFRAAFYAGVPFTDWTPHRFRISWYEKYDTIGMDFDDLHRRRPRPAVSQRHRPLDAGAGTVDESKALVTFALYGTKVPGRTVQRTDPVITNATPAPTQAVYIDDPEQAAGSFHQTDTARGGLDIRIDRLVLQNGKVVSKRSFITKFQPWPNIFLKNPKTPVPPGGKLGTS